MRRIIVVILVAAGLWMGWWVIGSSTVERSVSAWIEDRRTEGWVADYSMLGVRGFPNRFDTRISEIHLADPATGVAWTAPFLDILQLSYRPNRAIIVWPNTQRFSTPFQNIDIATDQARGSLSLRPVPSLELDSATVVVDLMELTSSRDWSMAAQQARVSAQRQDAKNTYRFGVEVLGLRPTVAFRATVDPAQILPDRLQRLRLDATVTFSAPLDRNVIETERPQITHIDLDELSARWGSALFRAVGQLDVDDQGTPDGTITLRAEDWRQILSMAVSAGVVPENSVDLVDGALSMIAALMGNTDNLEADLIFRNGGMKLGPIPLGPAPRIFLR